MVTVSSTNYAYKPFYSLVIYISFLTKHVNLNLYIASCKLTNKPVFMSKLCLYKFLLVPYCTYYLTNAIIIVND